jgi:hypothetical protein
MSYLSLRQSIAAVAPLRYRKSAPIFDIRIVPTSFQNRFTPTSEYLKFHLLAPFPVGKTAGGAAFNSTNCF